VHNGRVNETGKLIAIVLLASFAIERVVAATDFALDFALGKAKPEERRQRKLIRFCVSAVLGALVVWLSRIRVLMSLQFVVPLRGVDFFLTWLVLVGGADRIREMIGDSGDGSEAKNKDVPPIQILIADRDGEVTVKELPSGD